MWLTSRDQDGKIRKQVRKLVHFERKIYDKQGVAITTWEINADILYPYMLSYLPKLINDECPTPMCLRLGPGLCQSLGKAKALAPDIWEMAAGPVGKIKPNRIVERDKALELCRIIFSRMLRDMADGPIGIHITRGKVNSQWKLVAYSNAEMR